MKIIESANKYNFRRLSPNEENYYPSIVSNFVTQQVRGNQWNESNKPMPPYIKTLEKALKYYATPSVTWDKNKTSVNMYSTLYG
jgi:hypothetical protein